ncbi:hypothetical protein DID88_004714 [Monilinia fructigena]|uniref:Uncharacterized protein n=1 Tax=Monilinia fructigena TaxID=38457 RepID=A0A395ITZ0_9HELO|nr:hypothetical protein DID88_004714 [Monilinia fructigena]
MSDLTREDAQEYHYESIQASLQRRAVEASEPHKRGITLILSTEKILEITSQVRNHRYFERLGRPDFTKYTIDFKIWQHLFADNKGESTVPFTAVNPLIARPLDGNIDFSSMPPNPFPVFVEVTTAFRPVATPISIIQWSFNFSLCRGLHENDSGYHDNSSESSTGVQQAEHAEDTIAARRSALEEQKITIINEARRCEDEARKFGQRGEWMMKLAGRLTIQVMNLDDDEEVQFSIEDRMIELKTQRDSIDDEMERLSAKMERRS